MTPAIIYFKLKRSSLKIFSCVLGEKPPDESLVAFDRDLLGRHLEWLVPNHHSKEHDRLITSVRSWLIRTTAASVTTRIGPAFDKYRRGHPPPKQWRLGILDQINRRFATERNWDVMEALQSFCATRAISLDVLALAWLAAQPVVASIIGGASNPDQLEINALTSKLTDAKKAGKAEVDRIIST
jgi:aryl-alcohol dehydrogenase-like predicted oxidoreductase